MTDFRQTERNCTISFQSNFGDYAAISLHARRNINRDGNFFRGIDKTNQPKCIGANFPDKART